jgi:hypothetical protein
MLRFEPPLAVTEGIGRFGQGGYNNEYNFRSYKKTIQMLLAVW